MPPLISNIFGNILNLRMELWLSGKRLVLESQGSWFESRHEPLLGGNLLISAVTYPEAFWYRYTGMGAQIIGAQIIAKWRRKKGL